MEPAGTRAAAPLTGPRTAVIWDVLNAEIARGGGRGLAVVDVGGGTAGFAVPLARDGHRVTVVYPSADALAASGWWTTTHRRSLTRCEHPSG